jgi:hypothetical protein
VKGPGFTFMAPAGWTVQHTSTAVVVRNGTVDIVEMAAFPTVKRYRPALFSRLPHELDGVVGKLAHDLSGTVDGPHEVQTAGGRSWTYTVTYDDQVEEITFVFKGRREFELLCRRARDASDANCKQLVASFAIT